MMLFAAVVFAAAGGVWGGAHLAVLVTGGEFGGTFGQALVALARYPSMTPSQAWEDPAVPGSAVTYTATAVVVTVFAVAGYWVVTHLNPRAGFRARRNLGVTPEARFAKVRDLGPLHANRPLNGRFLVGAKRGWFRRRLLATEWRANPGIKVRGRAKRRQNDRGAVAFVGPSRQGKSVAMISGILDWSGPAILSSVKDDLIAPTLPHRRQIGQVAIYDPTAFLTQSYGTDNAPAGWSPDLVIGWSPLAGIVSFDDAQRAAKSVVDSAPRDNVDSADFWMNQVEMLLAGLFWIAAHTDQPLDEVVRWIVTMDVPSATKNSKPRELGSQAMFGAETPQERRWAQKALDLLNGLWGNGDDEQARTVGSIYATARTAIKPWLSENAATSANRQSVTLDWLISGANSLYLAAPPQDQRALAPAFGGMLNDLIEQAFAHVARHGPIDPPLLVVLDEAAQTPLKRLPEYVSTVAGLGIQLVTAWQSIAQIKTSYDKAADTILTNHLTKVFFGAQSDGDALDYVTKILGEESVESTAPQRDMNKLLGGSLQHSVQRVSLGPANVVRQIEAFNALLIHGSLPPAHIHIVKYFEDRHYQQLLEWKQSSDVLGLPRLDNNETPDETPSSETADSSETLAAGQPDTTEAATPVRSLASVLANEVQP